MLSLLSYCNLKDGYEFLMQNCMFPVHGLIFLLFKLKYPIFYIRR